MAKGRKPKKTADPEKVTRRIAKQFGTKTGNGSLLPAGIDQRSGPARRFKELVTNVAADLSPANVDALSEIQRQLIRRHASLCVLAEMTEAKLVLGEEVDVQAFVTAINAQNRLAGTLGITRAALDVTPSLAEYLAARAASEPQTGEEPDGDDDGGQDG